MPRAARLAGLTVLCLIVLAGAGEAAGRARPVQAALPSPNIGSSYEEGAKQLRLSWLDETGTVECFFVGSSVVVQGIDPKVAESAISGAGGPPLRCFNEGIRGARIGGIERKTAQLSGRDGTKLIVYGVTYHDLLADQANADPSAALDTPDWTAAGWLNTNSYLYRYYSTFRWYMAANPGALSSRAEYEANIDAHGFLHIAGVWPHIERTPYPRDTFTTNAAILGSLARLAGIQGPGTRIVIVEMPLPPTSVHLLTGAEADYAAYIQDVETVAQAQQVTFIQAGPPEVIPADGWADPIHLNETGARAFSRWLGAALAEVMAG